MLLFDGRASTTTLPARRGASANPRFVAARVASGRSTARSRPTSTRNRARCDSSARFAPKARATSVSSPHLPATPRPARVREQDEPLLATRDQARRHASDIRRARSQAAPEARRPPGCTRSQRGAKGPRSVRHRRARIGPTRRGPVRASVNICAALVSAPLMNTRVARGSANAKPRNSSGSSLR
jgi:hypothetical protein